MTGRHADYVYRNVDDSVRVRVRRRDGDRWDYDVFYPDAIETYSEEAGDDFASKRAALADANRRHGPLRPIATAGTVVDDAWRRRAASRSAQRKTGAQLDAEIAEAIGRGRRWAKKIAMRRCSPAASRGQPSRSAGRTSSTRATAASESQ